ncbi:MAG: methyltransferase [Pirellulales bacterium]
MTDEATSPLPPLPSEALIIDHFPQLEFERAILISQGRGQAASLLSKRSPSAAITAWYFDLYLADLARDAITQSGSTAQVACAADLPDGEACVVVFPISSRGEAELTRDLLQQAHERLRIGGTLITSVDNPKDQWLREQLSGMFDKVSVQEADGGRLYTCRKTKPLRKLKNFEAEIVFRDEDNLIKCLTRPGVFSHRHVDPGARQLMQTMEIEPGSRVLDLGCGAGTVSLAAALRAEDVEVHAVDCNARAVDCTRRGAELNEVQSLHTHLNHDGDLKLDGTIDMVLANPPYYSDFSIAERMVQTAETSLRPGGAMLFVTKHPNWYEERLPQTLEDVAIFESGKYWVACGRKPS